MKRNQNKKFKRGFSLVEILIYLAIFTFLSILVINSFITILASFKETNSNRNLAESGLSAMERITRETRQALNIDIAGTSATSLKLNSFDKNGNSITIRISSEDGKLNLYQDENLEGSLLASNINLTYLTFRRIETAQSEAIKIEMTIEDSTSEELKSKNFYNTVILRGGY